MIPRIPGPLLRTRTLKRFTTIAALLVALVFLFGVGFLARFIPAPVVPSRPLPPPATEPPATTMEEPEPIALVLPPTDERLRAVHVFYYPWYANPATDPDGWNHWNHNILPHWNAETRARFPHDKQYAPPDDIGSNFFPSRGPYSSADPGLIDQHFTELREYVIVVSWWGRSSTDGEGKSTEALFPLLFQRAEKLGAKLAVHLEPYPGRNALSVKEDIKYLYAKYGRSKAFYREATSGKAVVYLYDSYLTSAQDWAQVLTPQGAHTLRGTEYDAIFLGLWVNADHGHSLGQGGFDGFYTYFAAERFTHGSTSANWRALVANGDNLGLKHSSISVGPGYDDTRIRPWNSENRRSREEGAYFDRQWAIALQSGTTFISVTSYNEWMEGTQIEAAAPNKEVASSIYDGNPYRYISYLPKEEGYYVKATADWARKFVDARQPK